MKIKHTLLLLAGAAIALPSLGCAITDVGDAINDYYFPEKSEKDERRSAANSTQELDTIPNASEIEGLN